MIKVTKMTAKKDREDVVKMQTDIAYMKEDITEIKTDVKDIKGLFNKIPETYATKKDVEQVQIQINENKKSGKEWTQWAIPLAISILAIVIAII